MLGLLGSEDRHRGLEFAVRALHGAAGVRHLRLQAGADAQRLRPRSLGRPEATTATASRVAIVDAYDSPTLLADAQHYFRLNDPRHPLRTSQFTNVQPTALANEGICGGSGWYAEQALDVESVHSMAPGAHIEYVGANDCFDNNLLAARQHGRDQRRVGGQRLLG